MKFSIRDLFLVTLIVAMAVGWAMDHCSQNSVVTAISESQRQVEEKLSRLLTALERRGEEVTFSDAFVAIKKEIGGTTMYGIPSQAHLNSMTVTNSSSPAPNPPKP